MKLNKMVENIEIILNVITRPKMYSIQKIEDFNFFILGFITYSDNEKIYLFLKYFNIFLSNKYNMNEEIKYYKIIRLRTDYDDITLEILKEEFRFFLNTFSYVELLNNIEDDKIKILKMLKDLK